MNKLQKLLAGVNGASFISIDTETVPTLKGGKSNPHQGRVTKVSRGASVMVFQNKNTNAYENMVERRLKAEGKDPASFTLGPRAWGTRIEGTPFIEHKGETYLEVIFLKAPKETVYFLDGKEVDASEIQGLEADKPNADSQGGLENKVIIRTFKCDSITTIRVDGLEVTRTNGKSW